MLSKSNYSLVSCKSTLTSRISLRPARFKSDNTLCKWGYVSEILPSICIKLASNVAKHFHPLSYEHRKHPTMHRGSKSDRSRKNVPSRIFFFLFFPFFHRYRDLINLIRSNYQCCSRELLPQLLIETMFFFFMWKCQFHSFYWIIIKWSEGVFRWNIYIYNTLYDCAF